MLLNESGRRALYEALLEEFRVWLAREVGQCPLAPGDQLGLQYRCSVDIAARSDPSSPVLRITHGANYDVNDTLQ